MGYVSRMGLLDGWRFCPRCGVRGAASRAELHVREVRPRRYGRTRCPASQALVERDGRVLLGRRRDDPAAGLWDLPGGFVDEHEHPLDALRRELREETGLEIEPVEFLGIWMQPYAGRIVLSL